MQDFTTITEIPGSGLNAEQLARIVQRYTFGAQIAQGKAVLEVACGAGGGLGLLQQPARWLVGCDYTEPVLHIAQTHYGRRVPLICADAQQLPFADQSFDLIVAFEAIYYLTHIDRFLAEAYRLLSAGGTLLLCTSNPDWPPFVPGQMSVYYPNLPTLATLLASAGFQCTEFYGALPYQAVSGYQTLRATLRKQLLQYKRFTADSVLTRQLKQLAYGRLTPLPAELTLPPSATDPTTTDLTPLRTTQPDCTHRVLFALARKA